MLVDTEQMTGDPIVKWCQPTHVCMDPRAASVCIRPVFVCSTCETFAGFKPVQFSSRRTNSFSCTASTTPARSTSNANVCRSCFRPRAQTRVCVSSVVSDAIHTDSIRELGVSPVNIQHVVSVGTCFCASSFRLTYGVLHRFRPNAVPVGYDGATHSLHPTLYTGRSRRFGSMERLVKCQCNVGQRQICVVRHTRAAQFTVADDQHRQTRMCVRCRVRFFFLTCCV